MVGDDCDFNERLNKIGTHRPICINNFNFIEHNDNIRNKDYHDYSVVQHLHINEWLCSVKNVLSWNNKFLHSKFVNDTENSFKLIESFHLTYFYQ